MKDNSAVHTRFAMTLALLRAMEMAQPEDRRLFDDHFSQDFLPASWKILLLPGFRHTYQVMMDGSAPGLIGSLYCRTAYIDYTLSQALAKGCRQVVILGAGFDARAYRIGGIQQARVFELDLPVPQQAKQVLLKKILGKLPDHVTFIPINFDQQDLGSALTGAGLEQELAVFFIWEGVTQYIQTEAVDRTLETIRRTAAAGSEVVFTYTPLTVFDRRRRSASDAKIVSGAEQIGIPWISGLATEGLAEYLTDKGFELVEEVGAADYRRRFLRPRNRPLNIYKAERAALAMVRLLV